MHTPVKINGLILANKPYFEHDRLVTLFSPEMGKLRLLARHAQSKKSTLMGRLEVSNHIRCGIIQGRSFTYLQHPEIATGFPAIRTDFNRIAIMSYWFEIIQKSTHFEQHNAPLFHLLMEVLSGLNQKQPLPELQERFHTQFLVIEGLWHNPDQTVTRDQFRAVFESYTHTALPDLHFIS